MTIPPNSTSDSSNIKRDPTLISVVLPVYNGASYLEDAVKSVLDQTDVNFELIILNDGSRDCSAEILDQYSDSRIKVIHQSNMGLAATLNKGINLARGNFIARQDQDDLMLPGRLARQLSFLEKYPEVAMVGTWAQIRVGDMPDGRMHAHPSSAEVLRTRLLFDNPFVHSSMMIRTDIAQELGGYSEDKLRQPPEDYEFWSRIARLHKVSNLPEVLTIYREMPASMSRIGPNPFLCKVLQISTENLYAVLSKNWTLSDCMSLACLYHAAPNAPSRLTKADALRMTMQALEVIAGPKKNWPPSMMAEANRLRIHIRGRFLQKIIPVEFYKVARWIYKRLSLNMSR